MQIQRSHIREMWKAFPKDSSGHISTQDFADSVLGLKDEGVKSQQAHARDELMQSKEDYAVTQAALVEVSREAAGTQASSSTWRPQSAVSSLCSTQHSKLSSIVTRAGHSLYANHLRPKPTVRPRSAASRQRSSIDASLKQVQSKNATGARALVIGGSKH